MPDLRAPTYRPMIEADAQVTAYVRKAALESLDRQQGREPPPWTPRLAGHFAHMVRTDPGGCWVAEIDGLVVGYAQAFVRGDIWFLAQLFVQPEVHGAGVGHELLRLAVEYGRSHGARVLSVVASGSAVAQALYMRNGMLACSTMYRATGSVETLLASVPEPDASRKRVVDCAGWQDQIAALDREAWGAERRQDHEFYLRPGLTERHSFALVRDGALEGYGYVDSAGWIGPLAARDPEGQLPLLRMAAEWLRDRGVEEASTGALSGNPTVMRALLDAGWRTQPATWFMTSAPFGQFDRYHPSGGLML